MIARATTLLHLLCSMVVPLRNSPLPHLQYGCEHWRLRFALCDIHLSMITIASTKLRAMANSIYSQPVFCLLGVEAQRHDPCTLTHGNKKWPLLSLMSCSSSLQATNLGSARNEHGGLQLQPLRASHSAWQKTQISTSMHFLGDLICSFD